MGAAYQEETGTLRRTEHSTSRQRMIAKSSCPVQVFHALTSPSRAIRLALDHIRKQRESTQEQAAEGVKITEIVLREPHYGQAERKADLRELRGGA